MSDAQDKSDCSAEIIDDLVDRLDAAEAQLEKVREIVNREKFRMPNELIAILENTAPQEDKEDK